MILEIEAEDDDIDQDGQSPVDVQMPDTRLESVGPMDGSELGRKNKKISSTKLICFSLYFTAARVDEGYVIPTSTGGPMLILSATIGNLFLLIFSSFRINHNRIYCRNRCFSSNFYLFTISTTSNYTKFQGNRCLLPLQRCK